MIAIDLHNPPPAIATASAKATTSIATTAITTTSVATSTITSSTVANTSVLGRRRWAAKATATANRGRGRTHAPQMRGNIATRHSI